MFQRLKGAFDSLEEQARQRPASQSPSRQGSGNRRPPHRNVSPSRRTTSRQTNKVQGNGEGLSGPDPDPATFDPEKIADGEGDGTETVTQDAVAQDGRDGRDTENPMQQDTASASPQVGQSLVEDGGLVEKPQELPDDVKSKLRRLNKLESKYQDLLKAYRRAHSRNSMIEPFEARLRESTPLTSISDPQAFVEYLNQVNLRNDMVMEELKSVSKDRDEARLKLDRAEKEARTAFDEVAQLRQNPSQDLGSRDSTDKGKRNSPGPTGDEIDNDKDRDAEQSQDMFSVDDEVPRLHAELSERDDSIKGLESQKRTLQQDLATARESAEKMMTDLESKQKELEVLKTDYTSLKQAEKGHGEKAARLESEISQLAIKLEASEKNLRVKEEEIQSHQRARTNLEANVSIPTPKEQASGIQANGDVETAANEKQEPVSKSKKKNNKKKKKGAIDGATNQEKQQSPIPRPDLRSNDISRTAVDGPAASDDAQALQSRLDECLEELSAKSDEIDQLNEKLRSHTEIIEEVEHLREELVNVGGEHVEAKKSIKVLESDKSHLADAHSKMEHELAQLRKSSPATDDNEISQLQHRVEELESERDSLNQKIAVLESDASKTREEAATKASTEPSNHSKITEEFDDLKTKAKTLQIDLTAAQQLAASRFKEISTLQSTLQKSRPELTSLRTEVAELKSHRDELTQRTAAVRKLEARESSLKNEIDHLKEDITSKDSEIATLRDRVSSESSRRSTAEDTTKRLERDLHRTRSERSEALTAREDLSAKLRQAEKERNDARTRISELETKLDRLNSDADSLREEMQLKTAQSASAQTLMGSVRDQAAEMATQLKEARERGESLEEELMDAHKLMNERGREGETMRRILADVEGRADARVKEMRERMDVAVQERDRAEEEASSLGRRRGRELDDLKGRLREVERDLRRAAEDKTEAERSERDLRRRNDEDSSKVARADQEVMEVRRAMAELRDAADEGERSLREMDGERGTLRSRVEDLASRLERLQRSNKTLSEELRALRAKPSRPPQKQAATAPDSSRSSLDSSRAPSGRVASPAASPAGRERKASATAELKPNESAVDVVYLKNVLLQFLERKDRRYQMQLIPVLGMLLGFDKKDEQRWMSVVGAA